jgi:meiotically up-regulated gene 157 (Mug157) protein
VVDDPIEVAALPDVRRHVAGVVERLADRPAAAAAYETWVAASTRGAIERLDDGTIHLITGDIPAAWFRDSAAQVRGLWSVLVAEPDGPFAQVVSGLIRRHVQWLLIDPYANSFVARHGPRHHRFDRPRPAPLVWERKWELDSIAYSLGLWARWWDATGDGSPLALPARDAAIRALDLLEVEQDPEVRSEYRFWRPFAGLARHGRGPAVTPCGLVRSAFRPSDDRCDLGFHVPGNAHVVVSLRGLARIAAEAWSDEELAARAGALADTIDAAVVEHGVGPDGVLWYEVDGAGGHLFMDDANVPSLLSLPYLEWRPVDDPMVVATRAAGRARRSGASVRRTPATARSGRWRSPSRASPRRGRPGRTTPSTASSTSPPASPAAAWSRPSTRTSRPG